MTTKFCSAAIAVAALAAFSVAPANAQGGLTRHELKQEVKADKAKLQADQAAAGVARRAAEPENRREAVMAAAKEMGRMMGQKREEIKTLEAQAATTKDPVARRETEKQIGRLHRQLSNMQAEYGNALEYNIMPHPELVKPE